MYKHADILSAIDGVKQLGRLNVVTKHIPAHQDDTVPFVQLSRLAKLNVQMDWLAKLGASLINDGKLTVPKMTKHPFAFSLPVVNGKQLLHD